MASRRHMHSSDIKFIERLLIECPLVQHPEVSVLTNLTARGVQTAGTVEGDQTWDWTHESLRIPHTQEALLAVLCFLHFLFAGTTKLVLYKWWQPGTRAT